ncbi:MAG: hypothetical protein M1813_009760 [Trichoglossum hirsutum]|nr:MAG: hypothetical protein M1813_009760 [Trichoglossum hirsutum]
MFNQIAEPSDALLGGAEQSPDVIEREKQQATDGTSTGVESSRTVPRLNRKEPTITQLKAPIMLGIPIDSSVMPVFVLGSCRSGTTLIGAYIGSSPEVLDMGEYFGFHLSHTVAKQECGRAPSPYRDAYLDSVRRHARSFASQLAAATGQRYFCDSTPWNLECAESVVSDMPGAIYILLVRHYAGVVLSLERSYEAGFPWAGATWKRRAEIWHHCYENARYLPQERTVPVSYDRLCVQPEETLREVHDRLRELGFPVETLNRASLAQRYATGPIDKSASRQIAVETPQGTAFQSVRSIDLERWTPDIAATVLPIVKDTSLSLAKLFPDHYSEDIY